MRKADFDMQRVVEFRRTRSLSDGGRIGFLGGVSQPFSKSPSPQTTHSRRSTARNVCVSREFRLTKGAYTKYERVCQRDDKPTPALARKAGVESRTRRLRRLSPLAIQHRILRCVPEKVRHLAGERVNWSVQAVIQGDPDWVQEKTGPAPGVIAGGCSGRHIGVDQGCGVHHTVNACWGGIASICIGHPLFLVVSGTTACGGQEENSQCKSSSPHR